MEVLMDIALRARVARTSTKAALTGADGTPAYQAYRILQLGFVAVPVLAGLDKFTNPS